MYVFLYLDVTRVAQILTTAHSDL